MASIVASMSGERMNRWLLVGAAALALLAGILVFAILANVAGGDGGGDGTAAAGRANVLVARDTIRAGTEVTASMFEPASFEERFIVPDAVVDAAALTGRTARVEILRGQQISARAFVSGIEDGLGDQLAPKVPAGMRAYALAIKEDTAVGGLLVPGDRVDLVVRYSTKNSPDARTKQMHIELFAANVEVLARGQTDVREAPAIASSAEGGVVDGASAARRPEDIEPDPGAATVTLALTPEQVLRLNQYQVLPDGEISIALRRFGDEAPVAAEPIVITVVDN
jgi:Flp pilus assembly protein CpaB